MRLKILSTLGDGSLHVLATTKDQKGNINKHIITCSKEFYEELSTMISQYESAKHLLAAAYGPDLNKTLRNGALSPCEYKHAEYVVEHHYERQGTE